MKGIIRYRRISYIDEREVPKCCGKKTELKCHDRRNWCFQCKKCKSVYFAAYEL